MDTADNSAKIAPQIILIGAGIMSATLAMLAKELEPEIKIDVFERLDVAAAESSDAWNNAGTGHSAFCELNYTPEKEDGSIDTSKAVKIAEAFEVSRQFWSYLVQKKMIATPGDFIQNIPHMSFVWGEKNIEYLHKRYKALTKCHLFKGMVYTEDHERLKKWIPLMMEGRNDDERLAATCMEMGTDVNFGNLTRMLFHQLKKKGGFTLHFNHDVKDIYRSKNGQWCVKVKDTSTGHKRVVQGRFVFIGAGGGSLPLLLKAGIPEGKGFGGFPVSGQWLKCSNVDVIEQHHAKVYGKASVGAPPMSVPHLDTRIINGRKALLFGPYAGFSTKFLKNGSFFDLIKSIKFSNLKAMLGAGIHNIPLTRYLIEQVRQSPEDRLAALQEFYPEAKMEDWHLEIAGQRVQVIKKDEEEGGVLEFGTEVVSSSDGTIAALLGASPGASTAVSIMLDLLKRCFPERINSDGWLAKLKEMIPSYGQSLAKNEKLCSDIRNWTSQMLALKTEEVPEEVKDII